MARATRLAHRGDLGARAGQPEGSTLDAKGRSTFDGGAFGGAGCRVAGSHRTCCATISRQGCWSVALLVSIQRLLGHASIAATRVYLEIGDRPFERSTTGLRPRVRACPPAWMRRRLRTSRPQRAWPVWSRRDQFPAPRFRLATRSGPAHDLERDVLTGVVGQQARFAGRHREQFSFGGSSTALRRRPYFRRGMTVFGRTGAKWFRHFFLDEDVLKGRRLERLALTPFLLR